MMGGSRAKKAELAPTPTPGQTVPFADASDEFGTDLLRSLPNTAEAQRYVRGVMLDARSRRLLVRTMAWFRRHRNISQSEIAELMNTSQSAVSDIEKGMKDPRLSTLQRYARALGLELQVLLSGTSWMIIYSWGERNLLYGANSVKPVLHFDPDAKEIWQAVLAKTDSRVGAYEAVVSNYEPEEYSREPMHLRPVQALDPRDDHYMSDQDLMNFSASRALMASESGAGAE